MRIRIFFLLSFAAVLIVSSGLNRGVKAQSTSASNAPASSAASTPKTAEQQFKNIQVLKGIPADQLFPTMQFISASLGVECDYCHVQNAFEKDDKKPKQTARKMMEMMFAINKDNFSGHRVVTCNSCHRGSTAPLAIPAVMTEDSAGVSGAPHAGNEPKKEEKKENAGPSADQLIDKYVSAIGGAAAIDKVNSRVMTGTIQFGDKSFPIDIYAKAPDARISFTHMPDGDGVTAFNGHEGWLATPGRPTHEMTSNEVDGASIDAELHLATRLKGMFTETFVHNTERIDGHDVYVVFGRREGKTPIRLYFDQQSGLLVRLVRFGETALGLLPTQIDYSDYREVDGVKVPYRWTLSRPGGRFTIQLSELRQNVPIDDAKFAKPPAK
jgi:photosynthetic reaction center cytochrome c subunit